MATKIRLDDPDICRAIAEAYVGGATMQEMADEFGCVRQTVRNWVRDPRVRVHIRKLSFERAMRITRKIDSIIEGRLAQAEDWKVEELLKARREFLERLPKEAQEDMGTATDEISEEMDQNPEFAKQIRELIGG